jgi:putative addiction module component (TIGR02574 family)
MSTNIDHLQQLPIADKLRIVEELWDAISESTEPLVLHDGHQTEARRRAAELESSPELGIDRDTLWDRVDELNG